MFSPVPEMDVNVKMMLVVLLPIIAVMVGAWLQGWGPVCVTVIQDGEYLTQMYVIPVSLPLSLLVAFTF